MLVDIFHLCWQFWHTLWKHLSKEMLSSCIFRCHYSLSKKSWLAHRDMVIFVDFGSNVQHKLSVGYVADDKYYFNVQELYTFLIGTCYVIRSNIPRPPPGFMKITLKFNDTMNEVDLSKVCTMYISMSTMKPKLFGIQIWWYQTFLMT